jgi:hypothetical protein
MKMNNISLDIKAESTSESRTNSNPIFKIKPEVNTVDVTNKSMPIITETEDIGITQETEKVNNFSPGTKVGVKRRCEGDLNVKKENLILMNNNKSKKECESIRTILYPISKSSKQNPQNNTNKDRSQLVQSVVSACKTACNKRSSTEIKNMREIKQHQQDPQEAFKDKSELKAKIETFKGEKRQNTNFIFKIPRTKPCAENKDKKLDNSQTSRKISKVKKEKQKRKDEKEEANIVTLNDAKNQNTNLIFQIPSTKSCSENKHKKLEDSQTSRNILKAKKEKQKRKEKEEDDGPIVLLPCSNCCHTTVVYPCSCGKRVYCGTVCQVGHAKYCIGLT